MKRRGTQDVLSPVCVQVGLQQEAALRPTNEPGPATLREVLNTTVSPKFQACAGQEKQEPGEQMSPSDSRKPVFPPYLGALHPGHGGTRDPSEQSARCPHVLRLQRQRRHFSRSLHYHLFLIFGRVHKKGSSPTSLAVLQLLPTRDVASLREVDSAKTSGTCPTQRAAFIADRRRADIAARKGTDSPWQ
jgi:hypothetical protein